MKFELKSSVLETILTVEEGGGVYHYIYRSLKQALAKVKAMVLEEAEKGAEKA
jgi:hypothetical protein